MNGKARKRRIGGISATTHLDRHGDKLTKEHLEQMALAYSTSRMMYWNHETTLPPVGVITRAWVEGREDGEYELRFEGYLYENSDIEYLYESEIGGLDFSWEDLEDVIEETPLSEEGQLLVIYDPHNFNPDEVTPIIEEINEIIRADQDHYVRKAELPQPVIWVLVGFAGAQIASGFLSRIGEVAAEKVLELGKAYLANLSKRLDELASKSKPAGKKTDFIFGIPLPETETVVEGVVERANADLIQASLEKLPALYSIAKYILDHNPPNFFSHMQFIFNPTIKQWEPNYFITRKSHKVIKGPRYYQKNHPLHSRYEQMLSEITTSNDESD